MNYKSTYCHDLDIPIENALKVDLKKHILCDPYQPNKKLFAENLGGWWVYSENEINEIFDKDWIKYFDSITGLKIKEASVFYRHKNLNHSLAHIDASPIIINNQTYFSPIAGTFNWTLDHDNESQMLWYEPWWDSENWQRSVEITQGVEPIPERFFSTAETMYDAEIDPQSLKLVYSRSMTHNRLTLCRVNVPHAVKLCGRDRWCVSIRVDYSKAPLIWSEFTLALEHLFVDKDLK